MKPLLSTPSPARRGTSVWRLAVSVALLTLNASAISPGPSALERQPSAGTLRLPFYFEANHGQADAQFQFVANGRGCAYLLSPEEAVVALAKPAVGDPTRQVNRRASFSLPEASSVREVRFRLVGANSRARGEGMDSLPGRINYLLGNDPSAWRTAVPTFAQVRFPEVYPGVTLIYYGQERQLEFDFVVAPGADPSRIAFEIVGADKLTVDASGDLVLEVDGEVLRQHAPVSYQVMEGRRVHVASSYRLMERDRVELRLGAYDRARTLVIDPVFNYATYFGGSGKEEAWALAVDSDGAAYIAGATTSAQLLPRVGGYQTNYQGGSTVGGDAFVAKLSPAGTNLVYLTYLGGAVHDGALALALDGGGNAYLTGFTGSSNFPTVGPLKTNISGTPHPKLKVHPLEGFVAKLNPSGNALVYSAFLGGDGVDDGCAIAVDATGRALVGGFTESTNLPTTANALQPAFGGYQDGFVACINPAGSAFDYFTYLGGTNADYVDGIAVDAAGQAYVTGYTTSTNFWITNAVQPQISNPSNTASTNVYVTADAFVTKLTPAGGLVYSTYLGGNSTDVGFRIAADAGGNAYVIGSTRSDDFPVSTTNLTGAVWTNRAYEDVFVTKVPPAGGSNWVYSVVFGGNGTDEGWDLKVDAAGNVQLVGLTASSNFPALNVPAGGSSTNQGIDAFVASLNPDGTALNYAFYYGGSGSDYGYAIDTDPAGNLYLAGATTSTNLFVLNALQPTFAGGGGDAFVAKLLVPPVLSLVTKSGVLQARWPAPAAQFVLESKSGEAGATWAPVSQPVVVSDGQHTVTLGKATNTQTSFRLRLP